MDTSTLINWHSFLSAAVFSGMGLAIYVVGFVLLEFLTPRVNVWRELMDERNVALAIFLGAIAIGIAIIIGAAVHG